MFCVVHSFSFRCLLKFVKCEPRIIFITSVWKIQSNFGGYKKLQQPVSYTHYHLYMIEVYGISNKLTRKLYQWFSNTLLENTLRSIDVETLLLWNNRYRETRSLHRNKSKENKFPLFCRLEFLAQFQHPGKLGIWNGF